MPKKSNFMRYEELGIKMEDEDTFIKEEPIEDLSAVPKGICDESWKRLHGNASSVCSERENGHTQGAQGIDAPSSKCEEMCFKAEIEDVYVKEEPMEDLSTTLAGPCEEDEERLQLDASSLRMKEEASGDPGSKGTKELPCSELEGELQRPQASGSSASYTANPKNQRFIKKRKTHNSEHEAAMTKAMAIISKASDDYSTFGEYVASELRQLRSDVNRSRLKRTIMKAIIEMGECEDAQYSSSTSLYSATPTLPPFAECNPTPPPFS